MVVVEMQAMPMSSHRLYKVQMSSAPRNPDDKRHPSPSKPWLKLDYNHLDPPLLLRQRGELMVLQFVYTAAAAIVPPNYWPHVLVGAFVLVVIYAYAQGRSTTRERDLHARVILLTVSVCSG